jgi:hypothetical protein
LVFVEEPRVRWSSFGEGGVVQTREVSVEDVERAVLACEWMASFTDRAVLEGAALAAEAEDWRAVGLRIGALLAVSRVPKGTKKNFRSGDGE